MRKCSLFGFLTYALEFIWFVLLVSFKGNLEEEVDYLYLGTFVIAEIYVYFILKKAINNNLCVQAKIKEDITTPKFNPVNIILYNIIPFIAHIFLNLNVLGDIVACIVTALFLICKNNYSGRIIIGTSSNTTAYKVALDRGEITLIIKNEEKYPKINAYDTLELSHISGNYYLLKNVIKQEEENDNAEETQEKELLEI